MRNGSEVRGARDRLVEDFSRIVNDTEELLRAVASVPGDKARDLRASVEGNLADAKERLRELQGTAVERTTAAARAADEYVHEYPWVLIGAAALGGFLIGLMASERETRH